jgi:hypothetical protein
LVNGMDLENLTQDKLKSARDFAAASTQISIVLFAALIASWVGLWHHLEQYKAAAASRIWLEEHFKLALEDYRNRLAVAIRGRLLAEASFGDLNEEGTKSGRVTKEESEKAEKERREIRRKHFEELKSIVDARDFDAEKVRDTLKKGDWKLPLFSRVIAYETSALSRERRSAIGRYELRKSRAEAVAFSC